ncbi:MAG TPA: hypothetical protein PKY82_01725 [Pyrinomonadaceae bacterium]|nr:hypothetical protein [Pyrinomonadaceae bacterium]
MKDKRRQILSIVFLTILLGFSGCQKDVTDNIQPSVSPSSIPNLSPPPKSIAENTKNYESIRKVDFKNFTYLYPDESETFTLKDGKLEKTEDIDGAILGKIEYGDVTNDKNEEALINIQPITGGNCQCVMVYIYTLENKKTKLLWSFETYDRAQGGFKRTYSENSNLVVETFGDNKFENGKWDFRISKDKPTGLCCPTAFTKIVFKWNGEKFVPFGKPQVFDYDWKKNRNNAETLSQK